MLLDDVLPRLRDDLARVEQAMGEGLGAIHPDIAAIVRHGIDAGGKRLRPTLCLAAGAATSHSRADPAPERRVRAAASVELLHVGSLYHDDVIDESDQRRGVASANARWGNLVAVLGGDLFLAMSARITASLGQAEAEIMASTLHDLCVGQSAETLRAFDPGRTLREYFDAIGGKTAVLFATACRLGALEAGGDTATCGALADFGYEAGLAFQIVDDVLDVVADGAALGKPAGHDIGEGVYTLPTLIAIERDPELRGLLGEGSAATADEVRQRVVATGAVAEALAVARSHVAGAAGHLASVPDLEPDVSAALAELAEGWIRAVPPSSPAARQSSDGAQALVGAVAEENG